MTEQERRLVYLGNKASIARKLAIRGAIQLSDICCRQESNNIDLNIEIEVLAKRFKDAVETREAYDKAKGSNAEPDSPIDHDDAYRELESLRSNADITRTVYENKMADVARRDLSVFADLIRRVMALEQAAKNDGK